MKIRNYAPDADCLEILLDGAKVPSVTVYRDGGEVHVVVNDGHEVRELILGEEGDL
jgi:hypothetical protein